MLPHNDLPNVSDLLRPIVFADDASLSLSGSSSENVIVHLNGELENIGNSSITNKLTITTGETEIIIFFLTGKIIITIM